MIVLHESAVKPCCFRQRTAIDVQLFSTKLSRIVTKNGYCRKHSLVSLF